MRVLYEVVNRLKYMGILHSAEFSFTASDDEHLIMFRTNADVDSCGPVDASSAIYHELQATRQGPTPLDANSDSYTDF